MDTFANFLKVLTSLSSILYFVIFAGLLIYRWHRFGRLLLIVGAFAFITLSMPIVPKLLGMPLYRMVPQANQASKADLVVVPTAGVWQDPFDRWAPSLNSMLRLKEGLSWQRKTGTKLLLIGGDPGSKGKSEADVILANLGLGNQGILVDIRAKNSWETARSISQLKFENRLVKSVVLVTSAEHILRMSASLRAYGIHVFAAPVFPPAYLDKIDLQRDLFPNKSGLRLSSIVFYEFIGILWYWAKGRFSLNDIFGDFEAVE